MSLSKEQKRVVDSKEDKIVVMSAAAVGKTHTMIEKVRAVLKSGVEPSKIVCITFTNNAAEEIRSRLGKDYKDGLFIGTVHGYANYLLSTHGISTKSIRDSDQFDELFELVMENPQVVKPVDFLALDEAQDSTANQFEFILDIISPKSYILFADVRQSIYSFSGAEPKLITNLMRNEDVTTYDMVENYRNAKEIISYSNWIVSQMKGISGNTVIGKRDIPGTVVKMKERNIPSRIIKSGKENYGKWAILCRSNVRVYHFLKELQMSGIPCLTFKQAQGDLKDLQDKMEKNAVKVLTIHSAKGLEWDNVIVADQNWRGAENLRLMYVAVTRARDELYLSSR